MMETPNITGRNLSEEVNANFDPTDADTCMSLAHESLMLCRAVKRAVDSDRAGFRIGRDNSGDLFIKASLIMKRLGVLPYNDTAEGYLNVWNNL